MAFKTKFNPFTQKPDFYNDGTGYALAVRSVTTDSTYGTADDLISHDGATLVAQLPAATGTGKKYYCKNMNATAVTLTPDGTDTIDGLATQTVDQYECIEVIDLSSGVWVIV